MAFSAFDLIDEGISRTLAHAVAIKVIEVIVKAFRAASDSGITADLAVSRTSGAANRRDINELLRAFIKAFAEVHGVLI